MRHPSTRFPPLARAGLLLALAPARLAGHGEAPSGPADVWNHWGLEPGVLLGLGLGAWVYARGLRRLWARAGRGRVVSERRALAFAGGMGALAVALVSPLDPLAEVLFSAHMIQHLVLVLIAAPLLVLGAPEAAGLWAFGSRWRGRIGRAWRGLLRLAGGGGDARSPGEARLALGSVLLAAATLWIWHLPVLYDLAVQRDAVHAAEHLTFLLTAVLFWASVLRLRPSQHIGNGLRVVCVFFMAVQGSILGALITFAARPLYGSHAAIPATWGVDPLVDQQLAGLIMWVPPALLYIAVAAYLFVHWLEAVGRRTRDREARAAVRRAAGRPDAAAGIGGRTA